MKRMQKVIMTFFVVLVSCLVMLGCPENPIDNTIVDPLEPLIIEGTEKLMILQASMYGNDSGMPSSPTGSGFPISLVELYNNTDAAIDFAAGKYYLHIGNAVDWTYDIPLTGSIPAHCSFLITSSLAEEVNTTPRASLPAADKEAVFKINSNNFKIALTKNNHSSLSAANPFDDEDLYPDYIDMLGVGSPNGFETRAAVALWPRAPRRASLEDTDDNYADFSVVDYRGRIGSQGINDSELYKYWPRNAAAGIWDPISGIPIKNPAPPPVTFYITFNPEVDFNGVEDHYTVYGDLKITLTNYAKYEKVFYILNDNDPEPVTGGVFTIAAAQLKKNNNLLIVVRLGGTDYSKPINVIKN